MTFVLAASRTGLAESTGGGIGYQGDGSSVAVIFDTYAYPNTVAVVTDGNLSVDSNPTNSHGAAYGVSQCVDNGPQPAFCFGDDHIWTAYFKYDGRVFNISVQGRNNPVVPVVTNYAVKIGQYIGTAMPYVGFTAGTGGDMPITTCWAGGWSIEGRRPHPFPPDKKGKGRGNALNG